MAKKAVEDCNSLPSWIDDHWIKSFRRSLIAWYRREGRKLPWRETIDPYEVLVSEVMLQQTQIATVIPYFERFLERFPNPNALAAASESDVLAMWEGLGYYRRAKSLHRAAAAIVEDHGGVFPKDFDEIQNLPGVGRYTAGAVASFALKQRRPIVEANTQRLYARLLHLEADVKSGEGQQMLWSFAEAILPSKDAGTVNHAVMDLGAMICKPREPSCLICPVRSQCPSFERQSQDFIPVISNKKKFVDQFEIAVAVRDEEGRVLIWQRPDSGWWAGMWDLPRVFCAESVYGDKTESSHLFSSQFGLDCHLLDLIGEFRHSVTHHRIRCKLYAAGWQEFERSSKITQANSKLSVDGKRNRKATDAIIFAKNTAKWASEQEISSLPFSSSGRRMVQSILQST